MQEFVKSFFSLGLAFSLFPLKQIDNMFTARERGEEKGPATKAMDSVTNAALDQFGGTLRGTFSVLDGVQRGIVSVAFLTWPFGGTDWQNNGQGARADNRSRAASRDNGWTAEMQPVDVRPDTQPRVEVENVGQNTGSWRGAVRSSTANGEVRPSPVVTGRLA